jgi:hypothetical protein
MSVNDRERAAYAAWKARRVAAARETAAAAAARRTVRVRVVAVLLGAILGGVVGCVAARADDFSGKYAATKACERGPQLRAH